MLVESRTTPQAAELTLDIDRCRTNDAHSALWSVMSHHDGTEGDAMDVGDSIQAIAAGRWMQAAARSRSTMRH